MGWVEVLINKQHLLDNARLLKKIAGDAKFFAVVKSNAYGHGMIECAKIFLEAGVDALAVSLVDEAYTLREAGIKSDILLLGGVMPKEEEAAVKGGFEIAVSDFYMLEALGRASNRLNKRVKIHIKIDTGMGRLGFLVEDIPEVLDVISKYKGLNLVGVMSHFSIADEDSVEAKEFTEHQLKLFKEIIQKYKFHNVSVFHIANSAGLLFYPESILSGVRVGIALYGGIRYPGLKEAMSVRTRLLSLKYVPSKWGISYGRTYITKAKKRIGVIPFGYALGYLRDFSNKAEVVINGRRCKVLGRVCMDLTVVDLDGVSASVGDYVYILGGEEQKISVFELASWCKTITYEIFCQLGGNSVRLRRFI